MLAIRAQKARVVGAAGDWRKCCSVRGQEVCVGHNGKLGLLRFRSEMSPKKSHEFEK